MPLIIEGVEKLGFKMADVKILLATHAHFDHVAGLAELKRRTGAQMWMSEADAALLEDGGKSDFRFGDDPDTNFEPVKVDRRLKDQDTIALGGVTLTAHHHPGHTKGATSFTLTVREGGRDYRVVIANMGSINPGVTVSGMPKDVTRRWTRQNPTRLPNSNIDSVLRLRRPTVGGAPITSWRKASEAGSPSSGVFSPPSS